MRFIARFLLFFALGALEVPAATTNITFLAMTNAWRYDQAGTNVGSLWRGASYDDSAWPNDRALFYSGGGGLPAAKNTLLTPGPTTFYFRTRFYLNSARTSVTLSAQTILDDGAVVYVNGQEAMRLGMPAGTVSDATLSSRSVNNAALEGPFTIATTNLVTGTNVIAVELHQDTAANSDVTFGLQLNATVTFTNTPQMQIVLNEVLANNHTLTNANGLTPDWVELYNPTASAVSLADMSLTDDPGNPRKFVFPAGSSIPSHGYLVIEFDNHVALSPTNTGFTLKASSAAAYLFDLPGNGGFLVNSVLFGPQAADFSIGRLPDGTGNWSLNIPTRDAANTAVTLGSPTTLKVNEWLSHSSGDGDWFELFNPAAQPVALDGLYFSQDTAAKPTQFQVPPLSFVGVGPNGYVQYTADKAPGKGFDHVNFRLSSLGDTVAIVAADGVTVIDSVTFGPEILLDVSDGRFPDGSASFAEFLTTPSPGAPNYLPLTNAVINEVLTHTDPPLEDAVELSNPTGSAVDIGGWFLSNATDDLKKYRIASGTILPAHGYLVFYEYQFNSTNGVPFTFNSAHGDAVHLSQADGAGNLTGYRAGESFGAAANGVSFGRFQTSAGVDFTAMSARSFGVDNPASLAQFRGGTGLPNAYPKVGPVVINELMYHPPSIVGTNDNTQDEYIELYNITASPVPLFDPAYPTNTWRLASGVTFAFPANVTLAGNRLLLVVPFDPVLNPSALAAFRAKFSVPASIPVFGPYAGKLSNFGESLHLERPDAVQQPPHPDAGFVPYILVDRIQFLPVAPWPANADGFGPSLQRRNPADHGNDPANWAAVAPTAGLDNGLQIVTTAPSITAQPQSITTNAGSSVAFSVAANGTAPLSYEWRLDGAAISGATGATFVLASVQATDAGGYSVVVANSAGSATSVNAILTVNPAPAAPSITAQPADQTVTAGQTASFSVAASGTAPLSYFWRKGTTVVQSGASATLNIASAQAADAGGYSVIVSNAVGTATSLNATLTVNVAPSITAQPADQTVTAGQTASFSVAASGTAPLSYQWRAGFLGGDIAGATNATFTLAAAQGTNAGNFRVIISNVAGSITSAVAVLTVLVPPLITVQPVGLRVPQGAAATFSAAASGTAPLSFQWKHDGADLIGETGLSVVIPNVKVNDSGSYSVVASNPAGAATSAAATLAVDRALQFDYITSSASGLWLLQLSGPTLTNYLLEGSANLTNWIPLLVSAAPLGSVQWIDTNAPPDGRFYRARLSP